MEVTEDLRRRTRVRPYSYDTKELWDEWITMYSRTLGEEDEEVGVFEGLPTLRLV